MSSKDELQKRVDKLKEVKAKLITSNSEWEAYNQEFNAWIQKELGVTNMEGELHLAEILTLWEAKHDNTPKLIL